jgi:hypothetical protein
MRVCGRAPVPFRACGPARMRPRAHATSLATSQANGIVS